MYSQPPSCLNTCTYTVKKDVIHLLLWILLSDREVPESPECDAYWRPGQNLLLSDQHSTTQLDLYSIVQNMQGSIERNFSEVKDKLSDLEARVAGIEEKQKQLEVQKSFASSTSPQTDVKRKLKSPSELQVP